MASWWDYGYQTTAMANRTVMVDNNTWNNTHIATVGRAMASGEKKAWHIYRSLDVDYVLVVFGGYIGYPSDDVNKFLWMVRISQVRSTCHLSVALRCVLYLICRPYVAGELGGLESIVVLVMYDRRSDQQM